MFPEARTRRSLTVALLLATLTTFGFTGCGSGATSGRESGAASGLHYSALTLSQRVTHLSLRRAPSWVFVYLESGSQGALDVDLLAVSPDGADRTEVVRLADDLEGHFGDPVVAGDDILVAGVRPGSSSARSDLALWRWRPGREPELILACDLPRLRSGQLAVDGPDVIVAFEDQARALLGFRTSIEAPTCPEPEESRLLVGGPLPDDYRVDWVGDQLAVTGVWGETVAIQLYGRRFELLRRLRLDTGAGVQTPDLTFFQRSDGEWVVFFSARQDGAGDLYLAPLAQWRAGPLTSVRVVATADSERRPSLIAHRDATIARWGNADSERSEWIETAAILAPYAIALPGGEVVWRRPLGEGHLGRSVWTETGLLRIRVEPKWAGSLLTVSPYRPSFW